MEDKIILQGMIFHAFHGVNPEEKSSGQKFCLDVEINTTLGEAGYMDDLDKTIHYGHVYKLIREIVTGTRRDLIEAVAEEIAHAILNRFEGAEAVKVRVKKPEVPIQGILEYAAVEIVRRRHHG